MKHRLLDSQAVKVVHKDGDRLFVQTLTIILVLNCLQVAPKLLFSFRLI